MLELLPNEVLLTESVGLTITNRRLYASSVSGWLPRRRVQVWIPLEKIDSIEAGDKEYTGLLVVGALLALGGAWVAVKVSPVAISISLMGLLFVGAYFVSRESGAFIKSAATVLSITVASHEDLNELVQRIEKARSARLLSMQQALAPSTLPKWSNPTSP